jgi:ABC-type multidrug transport system ATPase subunit
MQDAVVIQELTKTYALSRKEKLTALDEVSFSVKEGELFGLIGPDGSGKSSLFRIIMTLLLPDKGSVMVEGKDVTRDYMAIREMTGYMPGRFSLYQDLSVEENLRFFATIYRTTVEENYALIRDIYVQLEPFRTRKAGALSGGMKQKLALCCALVHRPRLLLLDEPTTGVDAVSRVEFWDMLKQLKEEGITILVSTAYMDEASRCDNIALIDKGRILGQDSPQGICDSFGESLWAIRGADMYRLLTALRSRPEVSSVYPSGEFHHLIIRDESSIENLIQDLRMKGNDIAEYMAIEPSVEDVFMKRMK